MVLQSCHPKGKKQKHSVDCCCFLTQRVSPFQNRSFAWPLPEKQPLMLHSSWLSRSTLSTVDTVATVVHLFVRHATFTSLVSRFASNSHSITKTTSTLSQVNRNKLRSQVGVYEWSKVESRRIPEKVWSNILQSQLCCQAHACAPLSSQLVDLPLVQFTVNCVGASVRKLKKLLKKSIGHCLRQNQSRRRTHPIV